MDEMFLVEVYLKGGQTVLFESKIEVRLGHLREEMVWFFACAEGDKYFYSSEVSAITNKRFIPEQNQG